jgi:hypothetical protein
VRGSGASYVEAGAQLGIDERAADLAHPLTDQDLAWVCTFTQLA